MHRGVRPKVSLRWQDLRLHKRPQNDSKFRLRLCVPGLRTVWTKMLRQDKLHLVCTCILERLKNNILNIWLLCVCVFLIFLFPAILLIQNLSFSVSLRLKFTLRKIFSLFSLFFMNYLQPFCLDKFISAVVHLSERGWRLLAGGETSHDPIL